MPINRLYGGSVELMRKALNLRLEKQGLIQSNIANQETPGYTVQDFPFAQALASAMNGQGELVRTDPRHIAVDPAEAAKAREFRSEDRPVDLDEEMLKLSQNQLMYQVTTKLIAKKFDGLRYAIDEGGK